MTIEEAVVDRLLDIPGVTALADSRVTQLIVRQGSAFPAVRVQLVGEDERTHLRGVLTLCRSRVQVDAYAQQGSGTDPYREAAALATAIHGDWSIPSPPHGLSGWRGLVGGSPPTLEIVAVSRIERQPMYDPDELRVVRIRQDYFVWWKPVT